MEKQYTFAQRLQTLIDHLGITNAELAEVAHCNRSSITRYLKGDYEAKQDFIYLVCKRYNINEAWLMGFDVHMDKTETTSDDEDRKKLITKIMRLTPDQVRSLLTILGE